jgi:hypothetical protein
MEDGAFIGIIALAKMKHNARNNMKIHYLIILFPPLVMADEIFFLIIFLQPIIQWIAFRAASLAQATTDVWRYIWLATQ